MALAGWNIANQIKIRVHPIATLSGDLSDSVACIKFSTASGRNNYDATSVFAEISTADQLKIAVTDSDNSTELKVEIEQWDSINKEGVLWITIPTVPKTEIYELFFYFDSAHADNTANVGGIGTASGMAVWDSDYVFVHHLADDPTGTVEESTGNSVDMTPSNLEIGDLVPMQIGNGVDFDGTNESMSGSGFFAPNPTTHISFWLRSDADGDTLFSSWSDIDEIGFALQVDQFGGSKKLRFSTSEDVGAGVVLTELLTSAAINDGQKYKVDITVDDITGDAEMFIDSVSVDIGNIVGGLPTLADPTTHFGALDDNPGLIEFFDGRLDEFRVSDIVRGDDDIIAQYQAEIDNLLSYALVAIEPEEGMGRQVDFLISGFRDGDAPLSLGLVYFVTSGGTFTNLKAIYEDADKATPAANPVELDADGQATIFADGLYDIIIRNAADTATIKTIDSVIYQVVSSSTNRTFQVLQASDTLSSINLFVQIDASSGPVAATLPSAAGLDGGSIELFRTDNSANAVTIPTTGSETINGASSETLDSQYSGMKLTSDGTNWLKTPFDDVIRTVENGGTGADLSSLAAEDLLVGASSTALTTLSKGAITDHRVAGIDGSAVKYVSTEYRDALRTAILVWDDADTVTIKFPFIFSDGTSWNDIVATTAFTGLGGSGTAVLWVGVYIDIAGKNYGIGTQPANGDISFEISANNSSEPTQQAGNIRIGKLLRAVEDGGDDATLTEFIHDGDMIYYGEEIKVGPLSAGASTDLNGTIVDWVPPDTNSILLNVHLRDATGLNVFAYFSHKAIGALETHESVGIIVSPGITTIDTTTMFIVPIVTQQTIFYRVAGPAAPTIDDLAVKGYK